MPATTQIKKKSTQSQLYSFTYVNLFDVCCCYCWFYSLFFCGTLYVYLVYWLIVFFFVVVWWIKCDDAAAETKKRAFILESCFEVKRVVRLRWKLNYWLPPTVNTQCQCTRIRFSIERQFYNNAFQITVQHSTLMMTVIYLKIYLKKTRFFLPLFQLHFTLRSWSTQNEHT